MKTENQKQDTEEVYLNQLIDEAYKEFSLDRKLAKKVALKFAKWQSERMYSKEDLRNAYRWGTTVNHGTKEHFNEWFEQLKKK